MKKEKLLIVSYKIPYPLSQGGAIAQFFFLKKMVKIFDVSFCTIISNNNQAKNLNNLKNNIPEIDFKVFDASYGVEKESFIESLLKNLNKLNRRISLRLSKILKQNISILDSNRLDKNYEFADEKFIGFFKTILEKETFNVVQFEFFETLALLPLVPMEIKKIVVHHEIRSKRNGLLNTTNTEYRHYVKNITSVIENSLLNIADCIIVFNEEDKNYLIEIDANIIVSPFGVPKQLIIKKNASSFFNKFVFVGSEFHYPNKEGLEWFLDTIYLPNLNVLDWPIYITGFWNAAFKKKYKNNKNIIFTGYLQDLKTVYENGVLIAPILSGSGVRTKILEAFANKVPVMATPFSSEGLFKETKNLNHIIHFDTSLDFNKIFQIINDDAQFLNSVATNGFNYFSENFSENILFQKRLTAYLDKSENER